MIARMKEKLRGGLLLVAACGLLVAWGLPVVAAGATGDGAEGAATAGQRLERAEFEKIFRDVVNQASIWPAEELRVSGFGAIPDNIELPAGKLTYRLESPPQPNRLGRQSIAVLLLVDGREQGRVRLSGDLARIGEVVCLSDRAGRGRILNAADLTVIRREITMLDQARPVSLAEAVGKQLRVSLQAGAILYDHLLVDPPLVKRGDRVTIIARGGQVQVAAIGEVRETGARGEWVRVKNLTSRREIQARVVESGLVEVEFN